MDKEIKERAEEEIRKLWLAIDFLTFRITEFEETEYSYENFESIKIRYDYCTNVYNDTNNSILSFQDEYKKYLNEIRPFIQDLSVTLIGQFSKMNLIYIHFTNQHMKDSVEIFTQENTKIISDDLEKIKKDNEEINNIKNNLFNFFGIIVGVLGFIFVNFQLITSATSLSLGKMIIYMGLANVGLITGIIVILDVLSILLGKRERLGMIKLITGRKSLIFGLIFSILAVGIGTYFAVDRPESRDIIKRIEKLEGDKSSNNILGVNINGQENKVEIQLDKINDKVDKLQDENEEKDEKIKILNEEIDSLKNKK